MTYTVKVRGAPGLIVAEYECPEHGRFERLLPRDSNGDPPAVFFCEEKLCGDDVCHHDMCTCDQPAPWVMSAPKPKVLSVPCYAVQRGGDTERRPGMLDTRPLAEGMPMKDWKALQDKGRQERRHQQLVKKGIKQKRIQVGGG